MTNPKGQNLNDGEPSSQSNPPRYGSEGHAVDNLILKALPQNEFAAVLPHLEFVELETQQVLYESGERLAYGYFLNRGLASMMVVTSDARSVEVGMIGKEGFVGAPLAFGFCNGSQRAVIQIEGSAFRIRAEALQYVLDDAPAFRNRISRAVLLQGLQVAQLAACNRLHEVGQRLARWLLMTQDRVASDNLPITHELLAQMLGSGRPSVTIAAGTLQRAGTIGYTRGQVTVLDRQALERSACECYSAIRRITNDLSEG